MARSGSDVTVCVDDIMTLRWPRQSPFSSASQVRAPFTQVPPDSTFVVHGSIANLTWNVSAEVNHSYVEFLRDYSGSWAWLLRKFNNATVITNNALPSNVTSKLSVEGSATLVISNFSSSDAGKYECRLVQPAEKTTTEAPVHLLLAGKSPFATPHKRFYKWIDTLQHQRCSIINLICSKHLHRNSFSYSVIPFGLRRLQSIRTSTACDPLLVARKT